MKEKSEQSLRLCALLRRRGYPEQVCEFIAGQLNTDFTASKMIGYLKYNLTPSFEELGDEMLSILSLRESIADRHKKVYYQRTINEVCRYGLETEVDSSE